MTPTELKAYGVETDLSDAVLTKYIAAVESEIAAYTKQEIDDNVKERATVNMVRLDLLNDGIATARQGDVSYTKKDIIKERNRILNSLGQKVFI